MWAVSQVPVPLCNVSDLPREQFPRSPCHFLSLHTRYQVLSVLLQRTVNFWPFRCQVAFTGALISAHPVTVNEREKYHQNVHTLYM